MTRRINPQANGPQSVGEFNPPNRLMLTPGPSSMDPRVYRALASPLVGHLDPWFKGCMDDTQILLRQIFQTENRLTMPLSASGSGGIEASVVNTLEEGDEAIIGVNGVFSERMAVIALHTAAKVTKVEAPYGKPVDAEDVRRAGKGKKIKVVGFAQGETSSGVLTQIEPFRKGLPTSWEASCWWSTPWLRLRRCRCMSIANAWTFASAARKKRSARRRACRPLP